VLFIGVLPLFSSPSDRRATLGVLFAVLNLAFYYETKPFLRESTNALAIIAQYAVLLTFGTALVIEVGIARGVNPLVLGALQYGHCRPAHLFKCGSVPARAAGVASQESLAS
jgi:hypothetical protein